MSVLVLFISLAVFGAGIWLKRLNLNHLRIYGKTVPPGFEGTIDPTLLERITRYTFETSRLGTIESAVNMSLFLVFLFGGGIDLYDRWIGTLAGPLPARAILFFVVLQLTLVMIDVPFSLYKNFIVEKRHGFNTMTFRIWLADLVKSLIVSLILTSIVLLAAFAIMQSSPRWWWLWVWLFLLAFGVFLMYLSPVVIEPLFFKFEPLSIAGLEDRIRTLMDRAGIRIGRVFQVDASRRSRHSNAYFTGIGRVKRIVLFDTLLGQMGPDEVLAVLAHEAGHWKKRHVLKRMLVSEAGACIGLFIASLLLEGEGLSRLVGAGQLSLPAKVLVLGFLGSLVLFPITPVMNYFSRRDEREADRFAAQMTGDPASMASALVKLSRENLSNLHPHPLYAAFYYSHPPVVERVGSLREQIADGQTAD